MRAQPPAPPAGGVWQAAGKQGAVAAGGQEAVNAGIDILKKGGNAVDGAVATILALSVTDTGAGIPPEALGRVFDRFYKSPESRGAGLGLAIAKQLVEAHGGTISASSDPGRGTHVRFTLPRERPSGADDGRS